MIFCPTAHLEVERSPPIAGGMLGYTAVLPKIQLLPKKLPLKTLFRWDSVDRMLMVKNDRHIGRTAQTLDNDTTNGLRAIY